jgi:hypothetical protein
MTLLCETNVPTQSKNTHKMAPTAKNIYPTNTKIHALKYNNFTACNHAYEIIL